MKKAFLLAVGIFVILVGLQCFYVKKFTFNFYPNQTKGAPAASQPCEFVPTQMITSCTLVMGGLILIYALNSSNSRT